LPLLPFMYSRDGSFFPPRTSCPDCHVWRTGWRQLTAL
jgi:uncharacterized OB-fold protein